MLYLSESVPVNTLEAENNRISYLNRLREKKKTMWILTRSDTNQAVQLLEMARGLKFCMKEVEVLYYPISENKGADQLRGCRVFVFTYAKRWFSHNATHICLDQYP